MDTAFYNLTAETLARMQFAFTVSFHIIFPAFSIGLASYLAVLNGLWLYTVSCVSGAFYSVLCRIIIGFYPNIIPPSLTIHEAAAPRESLLFALYGTVVLIPLILGYTAYAYWVFRGKVDPAEGYH